MTGLRRLLQVLPPRLRRQKLLYLLWRSGLAKAAQRLEFNGSAKAWIDLRDPESRATYLAQSFWPEFHPMVAAFLRDGGDHFDVGANFGLVTFGLVPLVRQMNVGFHLFEANHRIVDLLNRSTQIWPDETFTVNWCAVTDRDDVARLTLPDSAWGHAFIGAGGDAVPSLRLDDYILDHGVERVGFLKMDVEGWELHALNGATRALIAGKVQAGFIEVSRATLHRAGHSPAALLALLNQVGFDVYFCRRREGANPYGLRWSSVDVNGTFLQVAYAEPLPTAYESGDVLIVHRTAGLSGKIQRAAARQ